MQLKPEGGQDPCRRESAGDLATTITPMRRAISPEAPSRMRPEGHADAVAEDDHAEDDPGHRLRRGDDPQGAVAVASNRQQAFWLLHLLRHAVVT
jgi:hypothetical protein